MSAVSVSKMKKMTGNKKSRKKLLGLNRKIRLLIMLV